MTSNKFFRIIFVAIISFAGKKTLFLKIVSFQRIILTVSKEIIEFNEPMSRNDHTQGSSFNINNNEQKSESSG